ncbi:hypothetical protein DRO03_06675 [Methanosarcinales archaeon]|nr:MAG: hypothetical protein DRO03_06675 [Methanosarcinales archaeon]
MAHYEQPDYVGSPSFSIPRGYLKIALNLLISGTKRIKRNYSFSPDTLENPITRKRVAEMHAEQDETEHRIRVDIFPGILSKPDELAELDIRFTWDDHRPNSYLAVEAKRLRGMVATLAGPYVEEGVMDFINGKYSRGHNYGIMLGYVLSKPIEKAISTVRGALQKRKEKTNETSPFNVDSVVDCPLTYKSVHAQKNDEVTEIIILHVFVDLTS